MNKKILSLVLLIVVILSLKCAFASKHIEGLEAVESSSNVIDATEEVFVESKIQDKNDFVSKFGRLSIPSVEISCQLNEVDVSQPEASYIAQYYTDMSDSAAIFKHDNVYVIADHNTQSFANLDSIQRGDIANIEVNGTFIEVHCYKTCYGIIDGAKLKTEKGGNATSYDGYVMYTYNDAKSGCDVFLTFWRK